MKNHRYVLVKGLAMLAGGLCFSCGLLHAEETPAGLVSGTISQVDVQSGAVTVRTSWSQNIEGKVWIGIIQDKALYQAAVLSAKANRDQTFSFPLKDSVPQGNLQVICIPVSCAIDKYPSADFKQEVSAGQSNARPFAWGLYKDNAKRVHPWNTTPGGMMMWDGEPFVPVGGMINTGLSWGTRPTDKNIPSSKCLVAQFELLKKYGLQDFYYNGFFIQCNPKSLAEAVRLSEQYGMHYGLHVSSSPTPDERSWAFVNSQDRFQPFAVLKGSTNATISAGLRADEEVSAPKCLWVVFSTSRKESVLAAGVSAAQIAPKDMGKLKNGVKLVQELKADIHFDKPLPEEGRLVFVPEIRSPKNDPSGFLDGIESYIGRIREAYAPLDLGPGMRLWIDPFDNELHTTNVNVSTSKTFRSRYAANLSGYYKDITNLNQKWGTEGKLLPDFEVASRIVPVRDVGEADVWMDPETSQVYSLSSPKDEAVRDLTAFKGKLAEEMVSHVADALKQIADVPVVLKHNCWASQMFINPRKAGGQDGCGFESYCLGDSLAYHNSLVPLAQALASGRHQWTLETETSAAAFEKQKDYPGYKDRLQMLDSFDLMVMFGAKGIYTFGFAFDHSDGFMQTSNLMRDPRQLEWMATYAKTIRAAASRLANYVPEVYGWYPANFHEKQTMNIGMGPYEMDGNYMGTKGQIRMAADGRWIVPASKPNMGLYGLFADWDTLTSREKQPLLNQQVTVPVWLLGNKQMTDTGSLPYKTFPLNTFTASGIGVVPPQKKGMTLNEFRKNVLGYEVFQTADIDGQTLPDGSLMVWTCSQVPEAKLRLPADANVTNLQGETLKPVPATGTTTDLVLKPEAHPKRVGNVPAYVAYLPKGYYYDETSQPEVAIIKGASVEKLLALNAPAWQRWLPTGIAPAQVAAWQEAEDPISTTFNQPRVEGYSTYSNGSGIGINTHWGVPKGEKFYARYEVNASQPFSSIWIRKMSKPSMDLEIFVDGKSAGKIAAGGPLQDVMELNPWNAGLGMNKINVGWAKVSLSSTCWQGRHVIDIVALSVVDKGRQLDAALLGGQSEASVAEDAKAQLAQLQGVQIDAIMLSK